MKFNLNYVYSFNWDQLHYFEFDNIVAFDAFKSLNFNQEKSLNKSKADLNKQIQDFKKGLESLSESDQESYVYQKYFINEVIINEIQRIQRYSSVLSIFSFYESRLKSICNLIESEFEFKVKIKHLNNYEGDLNKYWNYLSKVFEIQTEKTELLFKPINEQKKIRNIIAHNDGITKEKIEVMQGLTLNKLGKNFKIEIDEGVYIGNLLQSIEVFISALLIEIDKRYITLKKK
ncbi:hypothetical protein VT569_02130 [Flavobacterium psychrophilum]|uniref:hypothetical protein n=1 Tax=Flavobacterium psychrophilum TaxID=96345 RepID=UPI00073F1002|nr:hypothetical protein [Flavobacterium psychrophilum]GAQ48499.1 hypothetical protein FPK15_contig00012-0009 [Flavobacterium psychrophilum]GEJ31542.1 hypothetical protein FPN187_contig00004-0009 [Flavobacterium psychrophilum]GEJ33002.1 hypothetical protein FPN181_contig00069-0057 [Flavobacterium psychrophilum]GEJ40033.1 hypothetical protein FPN186_contig00033-0009 [Flavobacterium psychrophilum]GEJ41011.1 hypothetical protein FPN182_contig00046-0057 [Flavobacterium psychrophilum]